MRTESRARPFVDKVTVDRDAADDEAMEVFRAEVAGWRPRRIPDLFEVTERVADAWRRPVMLAAALGAMALTIVLLASLALVTMVPADIGWAGVVRDHLTRIP
jgi:hypothetical protein